jgi:outer membrane protein assembly factor BamB
MKDKTASHPRPYTRPAAADGTSADLRLRTVAIRLAESTLGDLGLATRVEGPAGFSTTLLFQPFAESALTGLDPHSIRVFRHNGRSRSLVPIWNSGVNVGLGYTWAKIDEPGDYVPIALPRDRLLQESLRTLAQQRHYVNPGSRDRMRELMEAVFRPLLETPLDELEGLRRTLAATEVHGSFKPMSHFPVRIRRGGYIDSFDLPHGMSIEELRSRLQNLTEAGHPLPEEALFSRPELLDMADPQWPIPSFPHRPPVPPPNLPIMWPWPPQWPWPFPLPWPRLWFCWFFSQNWPMYQHDARHGGQASGCSGITSTSVGSLSLRRTVPLDGSTWSNPAVVDGKIYVGTANGPGGIGTLYRIDLVTGAIEATFNTPARPAYAPGIGGTPGVSGGRVYISNIPGTVHCLDATTLVEIWRLDLRTVDASHNHPVVNPAADCWSGPVVAHGRVYIGCGEGEENAFGFVYCLDAATGHVIWLFSTNLSGGGPNNLPNAIPHSAAVSDPLPAWATAAGFTIAPDPAARGCSVWSSCAYDSALNRIYVGTGNSGSGDSNPQPDALYGSGVLALDAHTGSFQGFYEPPAAESYRADDTDVDVCGSPVVFSHAGTHFVGIGSKSGAFWIFDATTMNVVKFRQLLPYIDNDPTKPVAMVDAHTGPAENMNGVFGTPAVHYGTGRLFVGLGGYAMADASTTPFMRALDWNTLDDAWYTLKGGDGVFRYVTASPPMYTTANERGLSSPAITNDVVFIGTTRPGIYALDVNCGHCLWSDTSFSADYVMGTAIYGNFLIAAAGGTVRIYSL